MFRIHVYFTTPRSARRKRCENGVQVNKVLCCLGNVSGKWTSSLCLVYMWRWCSPALLWFVSIQDISRLHSVCFWTSSQGLSLYGSHNVSKAFATKLCTGCSIKGTTASFTCTCYLKWLCMENSPMRSLASVWTWAQVQSVCAFLTFSLQ